ncbi:CocE/NonD family hydrolase [Nocardioides pocheonensis]|uniref:CocE/NonD family hydrolase n=1 Tax=Nocardioides pocheonensis TaxID=661485 RepID=UPI0011CDDD20|nr:CocE/NonD family hydrolase [Nocardioides pocheonensis]
MATRSLRTRIPVLLAALSVVLLAATTLALPSARATDAFTAHGSARQVYGVGLPAGAGATLLDGTGQTVATQHADSLGGLLFRDVAPGSGYSVREDATGATSGPVTVHSEAAAPWDPSIYDQPIPDDGYSYLTTRDGTQLALTVHPPTHPAGIGGLPEGFPVPNGPDYMPPYPTLIEYSGYGYAAPASPVNGIAAIANLMGFAVVDVSMRGTGCSGGAFDFFEPLQNLDGYDVVETIAHQPWVKGHKVGMMGISYGGISQLFTAQLQPPDLAAISPMSVIDATATTLYPGGVLNTGFAVAWAQERQQEAQPAGTGATGTQAYAEQRVAQGDATCIANQALHGEAADLMAKIRANSHYVPAVADPLDPVTFVDKINVPTFMACQWEDEQTGGHCPALVSHFTGTTKKWFTFTNGAHIDSLDPETMNRWYDFLELYVAHQPPAINQAILRASAPLIYQTAMGLPQTDLVTLPVDPVQLQPTYATALAAFEQAPAVRVLFDNGAGTSPTGSRTAGDPYPAYERSFSTLPVPGVQAASWYLNANGALGTAAPPKMHVDRYTSDANALPRTDYTGGTGTGGLWGNASQWSWDWQQNKPGTAVSYLSAPLTQDVTTVGAGSVQLWVRSSTPDVDLQATVSEVRNGQETYVQSGWLRGSERKLATTADNMLKQPSTLLQPIPTMLAGDVQPMPQDEYTLVTIPLYFQGHAYRAGSQVRVTITAPNGTQPIWSFDETQPAGTTSDVYVASSPKLPSRLVLPVVPLTTVGSAQPTCPSLRNEPCRPAVPFTNTSFPQ